MQDFNEYLRDIHMSENPELLDDDLPDNFDNWLGTLEQETMIDYANDYAKECIRIEHNRISKAIKNHMKFTETENGSDISNWIYEECLETLK